MLWAVFSTTSLGTLYRLQLIHGLLGNSVKRHGGELPTAERVHGTLRAGIKRRRWTKHHLLLQCEA